MIARTLRPPAAASFFLLGPRGTGKSTWVGEHFRDALHVDLLSESTFVELAGHADRLEAMADATGAKVVVIDEVQKLPSLLDVHRAFAKPISKRCKRSAPITPKPAVIFSTAVPRAIDSVRST